MFDASKLARETQRTLDRLLPRLEQEFTPATPVRRLGRLSPAPAAALPHALSPPARTLWRPVRLLLPGGTHPGPGGQLLVGAPCRTQGAGRAA